MLHNLSHLYEKTLKLLLKNSVDYFFLLLFCIFYLLFFSTEKLKT